MELVVGLLITLALAWAVFILVIWLHRPTRSIAGQAVRIVPDVIRLSRSLLADPATPPSVKRALAGLLAYLVSPLDLVPEFIPGLGQVDDIVVAAIVLRWTGRRVGVDDLRANWSGSEEGFAVLRKLLGL